MVTEAKLKELSRQQKDYVIKLRRQFHENPEVGLQEHDTCQTICQELTEMEIPFELAGQYGIIAKLDSGKPGKTLLIRSDMDALPMQEGEENLAGCRTCMSKKDGVAHLCGHDGHMAMVLGAARVLKETIRDMTGSILFCFEQAEEHGGGIDTMLECLKKYKIDHSYGIHLYAGLESGMVSVQEGPRMASVSGFTFRIEGRGGHGSRPDLSRNPAGCIVDIISTMPGMMKARLNPAYPVVFSIGEIHVGTKGNIIATDGYFAGTMRFFHYEAGVKAMELFCRVSEKIAELHDCRVIYERKLVINSAVMNDPVISRIAGEAVEQTDGLTAVSCEPWYATESFGRYQQLYPGVLALVGIKNKEKGSGEEHHNPKFDIDEDVLIPAVEATVQFANKLLR